MPPVTTSVELDVRFLVEVDGKVLLRSGVGQPPRLELPGGTVGDGDSVPTAAARLLSVTLSSAASTSEVSSPPGPDVVFVACVEHGDPASARGHTLTVLYSVPTAAPGAAGSLVAPGDALVAPADLSEAAGVPPAVAVAVLRWFDDGWPSWHGLAVPDPEPWWNGLRRSVGSVRAQLAARREHLADVEFRDAAVAMCALVAAADGVIDDRERTAMLGAMAGDPVLSQFAPPDVERLFDEHVGRLHDDPDGGRRTAYRTVARLRGRAGPARAVVALGGVIGRADGVFDVLERAAVRRAAEVLGVAAVDFAVQAVASRPVVEPSGDEEVTA